MPWCRKCNGYYFEGRRSEHRCPPPHMIWCEEYGESEHDARTFRAQDAEEAAKIWADRTDCEGADYLIVSGQDTPIVSVKTGDTITRFRVTGESVPHYTATAVED